MSHNIEPKETALSNTTIIVAIISALATIIVALVTTFKDPLTALVFKTSTPVITPTPSVYIPTITSSPIPPTDTPMPIITASTTPTTTSPMTSTLTPTPVINYVPVIMDIQTRKSLAINGTTIFADIHFQDKDGNSYLVTYEVVNSTTKGLNVENDSIVASANDQISGAVITVKWDCLGRGYVVTLNAKILDKSGNQSNKFPLIFDCR